ncbi:hypothetical protein FH972_023013 [Carpinus fangiana]|uniref:Carrier domain-containing protein n=1 Tax=Carpinus fangiana TaxID=176857 RepID=A0A5N6KUA8_9ROSI|nr:hypothetical protein FH972_023013 [Carpinus fangiana]
MASTVVFYDLSPRPIKVLESLLQVSRSSSTIEKLLRKCTKAVRIEYDAQYIGQRSLASFQTLRELLDLADKGEINDSAVWVALNTIAQLGCVLAAAAAAAADSQAHLLELADKITRVAFRLGFEADRRANTIQCSEGEWALVASGLSIDQAQQLLADFNADSSSVTISGPPATLQLLRQYKSAAAPRKITPLPIRAPFHAPHLPSPDVEFIIGSTQQDDFEPRINVTIIPAQGDLDSHTTNDTKSLRQLILDCFQSQLKLGPRPASKRDEQVLTRPHIYSLEPCGSTNSITAWLDQEKRAEHVIVGAQSALAAQNSTSANEVAIVGMGGRFPNADTLEEFWDLIASGADVHQYIPSNRFDAKSSYDQTASGKNTTASPFGCFMKSPGAFDHAFFNISPREAYQIDPQQRLLLLVTQEALEAAGVTAIGNKRVGTFFGQATDDWRESHTRQDIDIYYVGGGMRAFGPGRLNYHYKWDGPSYSVDTACSSSLAAVELACKAIASGDCDLAVAGGGNLCSAIPMFSGLSKGRFTSPTGSCKTCCASADGYCRGEAVGVVVLQRHDDAMADKRNVKGTITGIMTNHSARASSITHPHTATQVALMRSTLQLAGVAPAGVDYVELHGTGTQAGDIAELTSVSQVFGQDKSRSSHLHIGAVKANVGHGEAAAGITSLIKALLMIEHDQVPPHCGIKDILSPKLSSLIGGHLQIARKGSKFPSKRDPRRILINNFNATGGNTCMVLQGPRAAEKVFHSDPRSHIAIAVSAKTPKSLTGNLERLSEYLMETSQASLSDLSYTMTARRSHYPLRVAFAASDITNLLDTISKRIATIPEEPPRRVPRLAFVFAGQGTQVQGVASELFKTSPFLRSTLEKFNSLCIGMGYPSFLDFLITDAEKESDWSPVQLQLAAVALELGLAFLWQSWGLKPSFVLGHSIGEYPALCLAGVISVADVFALIGKRAELMQQLCSQDTHTMIAVQLPTTDIACLGLEGDLKDFEIACYNSPSALTLSGPRDKLQKAQQHFSKQNIKNKVLGVNFGFHSSHMDPILDPLEKFAASTPFHKPQTPVISSLLGREVTDANVFGPAYLSKHCRSPVDFTAAIRESLTSEDADSSEGTIWIELSPGNPACLSLIKSTIHAEHQSEFLPSLHSPDAVWQTLSNGAARCYELGININWDRYHKDYEHALTLLDLPRYAFDLRDFWIELESGNTVNETQTEIKLTPLLHSVVSRSVNKSEATAEYATSLSDTYVFDLIRGHFVLKQALCPSSVYSILAFEAMCHLKSLEALKEVKDGCLELRQMQITAPLVAQDIAERTLSTHLSWPIDSDTSRVTFATSDTEHAVCSVRIMEDYSWREDWAKVEPLMLARIKQLESSSSRDLLRLPKNVLYKLFGAVVEYDKAFQGIDNIILDTATNEAIAEVQFSVPDKSFPEYDVHFIDTIMHFAGFVLNNGVENDEYAFLSDGWGSLRIPQGLQPTEMYKFHVQLFADDLQHSYQGNVYISSGQKIVASCYDVRFKRIRKQSLHSLLNRGSQPATPVNEEEPMTISRSSQAPTPSKQDDQEVDEVACEAKIKSIIAEESGVTVDKINNRTTIAQLGLDSILMMSVLDKIQSSLHCSIPGQETAAVDTYGELQAAVIAHLSKHTSRNNSRKSSQKPTPNHSRRPSQKPTPNNSHQPSRRPSRAVSPTAKQAQGNSEQEDLPSILAIIAEQAGVTTKQVAEVDNFASLGIDSLLSLDVIDLAEKRTGRKLPANFLSANPNADQLGRALGDGQGSSTTSDIPTPASGGDDESFDQDFDEDDNLPADQRSHQCKMRLIQGDAQSTDCPLFCLPPGDGTPAIYMRFPRNPDGITIYSPESPWAEDPDHEDNSFANVSQAYCEAIRETHPTGPFLIAGYSVGGAYAYEVSRLLLEQGEQVAALIIIDCPAPTEPIGGGAFFGFDAMTMAGYADLLKEAWANIPEARMRHTAAAAREFNRYKPQRLGSSKPDHTLVLWSTQGAQETFTQRCLDEQKRLDQAKSPEKKSALVEERRSQADMSWCYEKRTEFGPKGWDKWLGTDVHCDKVEGHHHQLVFGDTVSTCLILNTLQVKTDRKQLDITAKKLYEAVSVGLKKSSTNHT